MKIAVTGGTGFVGQAFLSEWSRQSPPSDVRIVSRYPPPRPLPSFARWFPGNVTDRTSLAPAMEGADAVLHLTGILAETKTQSYEGIHVAGTQNVLDVARSAHVSRIVYLSAIGASSAARSRYHRTKAAAEEILKSSGLDVTIFRPSVVFGRGDKFLNLFAGMGKNLHLLPLIGNGTSRVHPVWVGDLVQAVLSALPRPDTFGRTFQAGGSRIYTYRELMEVLKRSLRFSAVILPQPESFLRLVAGVQEALLPVPFLTREMVTMAMEDNIAMPNDLVTEFNMSPYPVEAYLEAEFSSGQK
ncbi:MAG: complex I NDUFA9 subunit family protein [Leptospirillum sp.]